MAATESLRIDGLNVYYGESHILRDVSLAVPEHAVVSLMGRNGAGKTTLLKSVMGLLPARRGSVMFRGEDLTRRSPDARARRGLGYVPQGREILPQLTVQENLTLGLMARPRRDGGALEEAFQLFPVLKTMLKRRGGDLSGGQQQQLAIARALVADPKLLLLDEPTEGIQPSIIDEIEDVISRIKQRQSVSILLVEQYLEFAWRLADYYYIMEKGSIVAHGTTQELSEEVAHRHLAI
ncbi:MAG TPA: urea ABC transporter ATP-binding subunit UrtE [Bryobacterales bacterium]|nr:urea ABC transporter ATP-binding subunit UrtE [Bryobacterales bacterium]